jgi:hypothetical protein
LTDAGRQYALRVGPDKPRPRTSQRLADADHVEHGDAFRDRDDERHFRFDRFVIAPAARSGGTKTALALAPVVLTASATLSKIGTSKWDLPPLPGVTPATTLVPYWIMRLV